MEEIITIPALGDNYIYLYRYDNSNAFVIDPGEHSSVLEILKKHNMILTTILATHHHWDHIGGIAKLKKWTGCKVMGPDKQRISGIDYLALLREERGRLIREQLDTIHFSQLESNPKENDDCDQ